jgi:hypothetical protein
MTIGRKLDRLRIEDRKSQKTKKQNRLLVKKHLGLRIIHTKTLQIRD